MTTINYILQNFNILAHKEHNSRMDIPVWAAIASTAVASIITAVMYRNLTEAKVKSIVSETYDQLIKTLSSQVVALQGDVERLRKRLDQLSEKELHYLGTITELTKERNKLQIVILEKESKIQELEKKIIESQNT